MQDDYDISKLRKKKKRVNSKNKGSTFERKVANQLNDRFNTKEFSRSPGSGAFATTHTLPDYLKIYGDLITPKNFIYCIECKKGYNKQAISSLFNNRSDFWIFMKKCEKDARACGKLPMLVFKQDRQPTLAIIKGRKWFNYTGDYEGTVDYISIPRLNAMNEGYKIFQFDEILKNWSDSDWHEEVLPEGSIRK